MYDAILFGTSQRLKTMSVKIADSVIQFSDSIKILGVTLSPTLVWVLRQRQFPSLVSIIYAPSGASIHLSTILWPLLSVLLLL